MSERIWQKLSYYTALIPIGAIFGLLVYSAQVEIKDLDLWLHLAMGKFITLHRYVPDVDVLSHTIAGKPWVNHEWLFQVIVYNLHSAFGTDGLIKMQIVLVTLTLGLLFILGFNKEKIMTTNFILLLVVLVFQHRFTIRPDLYSLLFFTIYIFVLSLHIDKRWAVGALFAIQVFWSNMHGFFFFGPLFVLIGIISESMKRYVPLPYEWNRSGRLTNEEFKRLKVIFLFVVLACFVNPLFIEGAWYPIRVFFSLSGENKIFFEYIQELQRPITLDSILLADQYVYYKLLILISFVTFVFNRQRVDISALIFWIVFLLFSLQAIRNMAFFAFAAYLVIVTNLINLSYKNLIPLRFTSKKFQYMTAALFNVMAVIWVFQFATAYAFRGYYDFDKYERKSEYWGVSQRNYPDKAVQFLVQNKVQGNFLNDFNSGAYLLGHAYPDIKVFIDGRTEVYGAKFFNDYREIFMRGNKDVLTQALENYKITGVLLNSSSQPIEGSLLKFFYEHKDWSLVYFDYDGAVFLKNVELNQSMITKHTIDLKKAEVQKLDLFKLGPVDVLPYRNYFRAYSLESMDLNALALAEAFEALKVNPQYSSVYDLIGKIYAKQKDYQKAFENFRLAVMYDPQKKENLYNFALAYFDLGQYEGAIKRYQSLCSRFPQEPKAYFFLAKSYIKNHEHAQGVQTLRNTLSLESLKADDFFALAELLVEENQYLYAMDVCRMSAMLDIDPGLIDKKMGEVLKAAKEDKAWQQKYCREDMPAQEKDEKAWLTDHCSYEEVKLSRDSH